MNLLDANKLFLDGQIALAEVESNGILIDTEYLDSAIAKVSARIDKIEAKMKADPIWQVWKKRYWEKSNMGSRTQLGYTLFDEMKIKYPSTQKTKTKRYSTDDTILSQIDIPFVRRFRKVEGLKKLKSTYLEGVKTETVDSYLHPIFNLNTVTTFRSSSSSPNFQNFPIRDPKLGKIIRTAFIPRPESVFIEVDYGAMEFRICACFWNDPDMMRYASDPKLDIHRDQAMDMFLCEKENITSEIRYLGKNGFVFPRLYGSYYVKITQAVWPELEGKTLKDGTPVKEWLASKGIKERGACDRKLAPIKGTYEYHVLQVQNRFDKKFPIWANARDEWHDSYRERGWFRHPTGFVQRGLYSLNDLDNHGIQGPAFHCLLWSLIRLVKEIKTVKLRAIVVGQIHDSILGDVEIDEVQSYLNLAKRIMIEDVRKEWPWIKVPLLMEAKMSTKTWWELKSMEEKEGKWQLKT